MDEFWIIRKIEYLKEKFEFAKVLFRELLEIFFGNCSEDIFESLVCILTEISKTFKFIPLDSRFFFIIWFSVYVMFWCTALILKLQQRIDYGVFFCLTWMPTQVSVPIVFFIVERLILHIDMS